MNIIRKIFSTLNSKAAAEKLMKYRLFLGHHYSTESNNLINCLSRIYCVTFLIVVSLGIILGGSPMALVKFKFTILEFYINILASFVSGQNYFKRFYAAISVLDGASGYPGTFISFRSYIPIIFLLLGRGIRFNILLFEGLNLMQTLNMLVIFSSVGVSYIPMIMVYDILRLRIKHLRCCFKYRKEVNHILDYRAARKVTNLTNIIETYNELLDKFHDNNLMMHVMMCSMLAINFPKVVTTIYGIIKDWLEEEYIRILGGMLGAVYNAGIACVPGYLAEFIVQEVDLLIDTLSEKLVLCKDDDMRAEIEHALEILSLRPFKFSVLRAVAVDASLPAAFVSLSVTYVIVLVQLRN